ncbi:hypothetical protein [Microbulbifer sp. SSSA005]|uniref:hypothetical protein n=1 Tax=Microbulbifer sp. SSSA005 TaxID=3243378 RepID=UPI0040390DA6
MSFFGGLILFIAIVGTATMVGNKLRGKETSSWKSIWGPFVFFGAIGLGLFISGQDEPTEPTRQLSPAEITAITLIRETMTRDVRHLLADNLSAHLDDGVAVLTESQAAYWVKDEEVYAANGIAMIYSPKIEKSPVNIDFDTVELAVKDGQ